MTALMVAAGGFLGAVARASVNHWLQARKSGSFPYATLTVNLLGSFLLGFLISLHAGGIYLSFIGTGFMGAFTTFSAFKMENVRLLKGKKHSAAAGYILLTCVFGIALAFAGYMAGQYIRL
jgi:CrcB protein